MAKTLIVIDMQNDFVTGSLANQDAQQIIPFIKEEIESGNYHKVFFTKDTHLEDYMNTQEGHNLPIAHCIKDTDGWEIVPELIDYATSDCIICKPTFGTMVWQTLNIGETSDEIVLVGTCTDICVISNALILKAIYPELTISVFANGCAGLTPEKHEAALEVMRSCQINVIG